MLHYSTMICVVIGRNIFQYKRGGENISPSLQPNSLAYQQPQWKSNAVVIVSNILTQLLAKLFGSIGSSGSTGSGYGAPSSGYGAPSSGYGAPSSGYGAPSSGYGAPSSSYGAPNTPNSGYGAPSSGYGTPNSGYNAPNNNNNFGGGGGGGGIASKIKNCSSFFLDAIKSRFFKNMGQSRPLFRLFSSFPHSNFNHTN